MTAADLAAANVGAVYAIAGFQCRRLGGSDYDELVGDGMVGLMQAAQRFDPSRFDGRFATYAKPRIAGAMLDGYRRRYYRGHQGQGGFRSEVGLDEDSLPVGPSAEDEAMGRLTLGDLLGRVAALPRPLRAVVAAACDNDGARGGAFADLAAREGVTATRISQRLAEARRRLAA